MQKYSYIHKVAGSNKGVLKDISYFKAVFQCYTFKHVDGQFHNIYTHVSILIYTESGMELKTNNEGNE